MISQDLVETYQRDGVVCLRDAIPEKWLALGREGIDQNLKNPGRFFRDHTPTGACSRYVFEYWTWPQTPQFEDVIRNSPLGEIAGTLMQANHVHMVMDNWFMREAGASNGAPWHHDEPYFDFGGTLCIIWIPLERAPIEDGLTFVRGSHRWGQLYVAPEFSENVPFVCEGSQYQPVPDIDALSEDYEFLSWEVDVGDCLVFDFRTLHCVTNRDQSAQQSQRRMTFRFGADDTIFSPRGKWTEETSSFLMNLGQKPNGPIDCDLMPKVWAL